MAKLTAAQIKEQTKKIQEAIAKHKRESKGENFTALKPEEIEAKLKRVKSPMIVSQNWGTTTPGGTINYSVGIHNPDPVPAAGLYMHVWFGSGKIDPVVGTFLTNVDARLPRLTQPPFPGVALAPGTGATMNFSIKVPATVEKTVYIGNCCLMYLEIHDMGKYLDRASFPLNVT